MDREPTASLVNVLGTSRSGSTLLHLMLGNGSDTFAIGEVSDWYHPVKTHHFEIQCACEQVPCPVWGLLAHFPENQFHVKAAEVLGVHFLVDNSKNPVWVVDNQAWARDSGLTLFNVAIWKDPVDLAFSYWRRGRDAMFWRRPFTHYYGRFLRLGLPMMTVSHSELTRRPAETVKTICNLVGMPWFEGKERFWEGEHHHLYGSKGVRDQLGANAGEFSRVESFPAEFSKNIPQIEESVSEDPKVSAVIDGLRGADISVVSEDSLPHRFDGPKLKPYWYYVKQARRALKKRFPEEPRRVFRA